MLFTTLVKHKIQANGSTCVTFFVQLEPFPSLHDLLAFFLFSFLCNPALAHSKKKQSEM